MTSHEPCKECDLTGPEAMEQYAQRDRLAEIEQAWEQATSGDEMDMADWANGCADWLIAEVKRLRRQVGHMCIEHEKCCGTVIPD